MGQGRVLVLVMAMKGEMSPAKRERERVEANYQYFVSLGESRASLTRLPFMGLLTAILLGLVLIPSGSMVFYGEHHVELLWLFYAHLVMIGFSLVVCVVSAFQGWVYRFQVFSSGLMTLFALIGWVYAACFMALGIASTVPNPEWEFAGGAMVSGERLALFSVIGFVYVCGAFVVHVLLLRHRLRVGHSEKRTMGNYLAASSAYSSKSLWIIFAVALVGPNILTGGEYLLVTVGGLGFLLFASVSPSLPVEFGYLAYLKSQDRKYWEQRPPKIVTSRAQKIRALKKVGKVLLIIIAVIVVLAVLNEVVPALLA